MAITTCATISRMHAHPSPSQSQPHSHSHSSSHTDSFPIPSLAAWSSKSSLFNNFKSFHLKLHMPARATLSPLINNDKDAAILIETVSIVSPDADRVPKMMSSRARRAQSSQRHVQIKSPSPPSSDSGTVAASRPYTLKASATTAAAPAITVNTKLKPATSNLSDRAPLKTAPSFVISPVDAVHRYIQDEWGSHSLGVPDGPPTRGHWRLDETASCCAFATCPVVFTLLNRRHHCRRCGEIFCCQHSMQKVPLDQHARIHVDGTLERSCEHCYEDYQIWKHASKSRANSVASATAAASAAAAIAAAKTTMAPLAANPGFINDSPFIDHPMYVPRSMRPQEPGELNPLLTGTSQSTKAGSSDSRIIDYNWSTF